MTEPNEMREDTVFSISARSFSHNKVIGSPVLANQALQLVGHVIQRVDFSARVRELGQPRLVQ